MSTTTTNIAGLASNFDWTQFVDQMDQINRIPETKLQNQQNSLQQINNAYGSIQTELGVLQNRLTTLQAPSFFESRLATSSDTTVANATAADGAVAGSYTFTISQLATASRQLGTTNMGGALSATTDVSGVTLSDAGFATPATEGTFTVNGKQITVATTDTLQQVFDNISTATGGDVTASYDPATDAITLSGSGEIILGSATDTSNFLQVAKLHNNGTNTTTSTAALGAVRTNVSLDQSNLATAVSDGGSGAGEFTINGVSISFDASSDSIQNVLDRINSSAAGVSASYDTLNDRFVLTNKTTGDMGVALEDVTGNFLAATGLSSGTLSRGNDLTYQINGGGDLTSQSNTITSDSSGLTGVSVTASAQGTTTVTVGSDTAKIKDAITQFVDEYNKVQSMIGSQTAISTDSTGKVTAGLLSNEDEAQHISSQLRSIVNATASGLSGVLKNLDSLGIVSNGNDDTISLQDSQQLDDALANHLSDVNALFNDSTNGIATKLNSFIDATIGDNGTLISHTGVISKQISDIDTQVASMERYVQSQHDSLVAAFTAMEQAQQTANLQLQYLSHQFGTSSTSG